MSDVTGILILVGLIVCIVLLAVVIINQNKQGKAGFDGEKAVGSLKDAISSSNSQLRQELSGSMQGSFKLFSDSISDKFNILSNAQKSFSETQGKSIEAMDKSIKEKQSLMNESVQGQITQIKETITSNQKLTAEAQNKSLEDMNKSINDKLELMSGNVQSQMKQLEERFKNLEDTNQKRLGEMRETISNRLNYIQEDNNKKLEEIRATVDDKLQKTLEEKMTSSFKLVSERLEQVYKGLGEMQTIASGVGDLKKVLSNVKTRGILGEIQLGAILGEILTPDQYDTEVATIPDSREHVEFAVKLPAKDSGEFIYLPIDSKFPGDTYASLQEAYASGNPEEIKQAYRALEAVIKKSAKDIHDKYICPPYTTAFGLMFLPFEGLYAEVVNHGLVEVLQRDYSVNIVGPSTMAAMLNSLQMGFKTLQIQKRSNQVWEILSAVKTEFDTFEKAFSSAQKRIKLLDEDLERLVGTRSRAMQRKLRAVQTMELDSAEALLEIEDNSEIED